MGEKLNAGDVCTRIVTVATREMTLVSAAQLMRDHHVGCVVVVDETAAGRLVVGILTDRDISPPLSHGRSSPPRCVSRT